RRLVLLLHLRQRADDGVASDGEGPRLVRQRVGVLVPAGGSRRPALLVQLPRSVRNADVVGKRVLVRADLNVPLENGRVADDTRIRASLATLRLLLERSAEVVVCSHLGRPKGPDPAFAIAPVAERLLDLVHDERIRVLENTRFDPGETKNDPETARQLAEGCDLYVNDAFGSVHRA